MRAQTAEMRYWIGSAELELLATYSTLKSLAANDQARHANDISRNTNWPCAAARPAPSSAVAGLRADQRQDGLRQRQAQRDDQGEMTEFRDHGLAFLSCTASAGATAPAFLRASPTSGGM